jgi:hypothetical protein
VPDIDKRLLISAPIVALVVFVLGFGLGSLLSGGSDDPQANDTTAASTPSGESQAEEGSESLGSGGVAAEGDATAVIIPSASDDSEISEYGSVADRDQMITALGDAGLAGNSRSGILLTADRICYDLERLQAQKRSPAFAVRVVWNESLAELERNDLAAFSAVFASAPFYLCPNSLDYSREVAYWLGF